MWEAAEAALASRTVLRDRDGDRDGESGSAATPVPVVMCLWKRHHRLPSILAMIARQTVACDLYLWNNDVAQHDAIVAAVAAAPAAPGRVVVATSPANIGGFGRFFWARELATTSSVVVFLDDDEIVDDTCVETFLGEATPRRVVSVWGFQFTQRLRYWRRQPAAVGQPAKYCGTGGMVSDTSIFRDERLFRCSVDYWFCEDIWLSYFASTALGWGLAKSGAEVGWLMDEAAQFPGLRRAKNRFFRRLNLQGGWVDPQSDPRADSQAMG
jgi:hypothetical protein